MQEFGLQDATVRVRRPVIDSFLEAFGAYRSRGEKVLKRHLGVAEIDPAPDASFSTMKFLGAMRELQEQFGASFLRKVGTHIFERAQFPPGLDTAAAVFASIDVAYTLNSVDPARSGGSYAWRADGDAGGVMVCDNPYPCAFDLGMFDAIHTRFAPGSTVEHDESSCRHRGGTSCTYTIRFAG